MDYASAVEQLTFHCGTNPNTDDARWSRGFLQTLNPYQRELVPDAMRDVGVCVDVISDHLKTADFLDRSVINSLWGINHYARAWAIHPDGLLQRNNLISDDDRDTLSTWLDDLSERVAMMLDGEAKP